MNKTAINGAIGFSVLSVGATIDAALGLGGVAWLAELCLTDESDMAAMDMAPRDVNPVPLLALSMGATATAFGLIAQDQARSLSVHAIPDASEQAAILSTMLLMAGALGKTSRAELSGFYRIATHNELDPAILEMAMARFNEMQASGEMACNLEPLAKPLSRRRVLAAAMLMVRKPDVVTPQIEALIERIIDRVGATMEDATNVKAALDVWDEDCSGVQGLPLFSLLRDRPLALTTA
ncbi:MAG: hypothetical protein AAFX07_09735 [Pseudomonadota bacterium]